MQAVVPFTLEEKRALDRASKPNGAFLKRLEPIDALDERRLARARRTAHDHDFA
jgi:hypothetical protein